MTGVGAALSAPNGKSSGTTSTPRFWRSPALSQHSKLRSTMERYDFEFEFRLDVIAVAQQHKRDTSVALLIVPVKIPECGGCPWWDYCRLELERPPGDVSLLPRIGWTQWKVHRDHGVTNRAELAALDPLTARLVVSGVDVAAVRSATDGLDRDEDLADVTAVTLSQKDLELLASEGVTSIGDVQQLCARTASYSDVRLRALPTHIDLARAALGPEPVYRRRGVDHVTVPRADIEADVDMENIEEGCYLWGCHITDRSGRKVVKSGYQPFVTWALMTPEAEEENSGAFWAWLMGLRTTAHESGLTFAAYCYNASAENQYLGQFGQLADIEDEVERFIKSEEWVDLLAVWNSQLITGGSSALKVVAPLVGFSWDVEDPGGGESMLRYDAAVGTGPTRLRPGSGCWTTTVGTSRRRWPCGAGWGPKVPRYPLSTRWCSSRHGDSTEPFVPASDHRWPFTTDTVSYFLSQLAGRSGDRQPNM